jgi:hypothetical protein
LPLFAIERIVAGGTLDGPVAVRDKVNRVEYLG